jgi:hypothetical protein
MNESNATTTKDLLGLLPKHVYLTRQSDFTNFRTALETAGNLLLPGWRYTFRVEGALHRTIRARAPEDSMIKKIDATHRPEEPVSFHSSSSSSSSSSSFYSATSASVSSSSFSATAASVSSTPSKGTPSRAPPPPQETKVEGKATIESKAKEGDESKTVLATSLFGAASPSFPPPISSVVTSVLGIRKGDTDRDISLSVFFNSYTNEFENEMFGAKLRQFLTPHQRQVKTYSPTLLGCRQL